MRGVFASRARTPDMAQDVLDALVEARLVAVVRASSPARALEIVDALAEGGVRAFEIAFTVPQAENVVARLVGRADPRHAIGAGTVLSRETARRALDAGASFLVGPCFDEETSREAARARIPYIPGAGTVGEIVHATRAGADIVKVFPGETLGPAFVRAVRGPFPHIRLMPTGGVTVENVGDWFRAGAVSVGVGSALTGVGEVEDLSAVTTRARRFLEAIAKVRG